MASAALLLGETLSGLQLTGAVLIMAGLYINVFGLRLVRPAWRADKKKPRRRGYTQLCV
nr:Probable amino-acid metabolite efflux pump [Klebsiella pneumoniae]